MYNKVFFVDTYLYSGTKFQKKVSHEPVLVYPA